MKLSKQQQKHGGCADCESGRVNQHHKTYNAIGCKHCAVAYIKAVMNHPSMDRETKQATMKAALSDAVAWHRKYQREEVESWIREQVKT